MVGMRLSDRGLPLAGKGAAAGGLILFSLALLPGIPCRAETVTTVEMDLYEIVINGRDDWKPFSLARARLDVEAERDEHVKSKLSLLGELTAAPTEAEQDEAEEDAETAAAAGEEASAEDFLRQDSRLEIYRAWTKVRLPWFKITLGRAPLSWGEGAALNAGDVFFSPWNASASFSSDNLRDNALWQAALNWPLGRHSFVEGVYRAPGIDLSAVGGLSSGSEWEKLGAGGRFVTRLMDVKLEGGTAYDGSGGSHRPYLSLQGHLFTNWHLSSSTVFPCEDMTAEAAGENWDISAGVYHLISLEGDSDVNLRLEGLVQPGGEWSALDADSADKVRLEGEPYPYGVLLYPEVSWGIDSTRRVLFRSLLSPVDLSGMALAGFEWSPYQGLTLLANAAVQYGDESDTFALDRPGGVMVSLGTNYIY